VTKALATVLLVFYAISAEAADGSRAFSRGMKAFEALDYDAARRLLAKAKIDRKLPKKIRAQAAKGFQFQINALRKAQLAEWHDEIQLNFLIACDYVDFIRGRQGTFTQRRVTGAGATHICDAPEQGFACYRRRIGIGADDVDAL